MRTPPWLTVLDDTIAACITHHRTDLAGKLERRRSLLLDPRLRVPVIGELNQGKSQLVNALVNAPVCAVGDDVTTVTPTAVEHAEAPTAALVTNVPTSGRRAIGPANAEPARVPVPVEDVAGKALATGREDVHAEVGLPRDLLSGGLVLIDTPGLGGVGSLRTAATFSLLANADAVLMISDATCELCTSELELLKKVAKVCPAVTVVLTKIDMVPRWRGVAERNRARLAAAGLRVKLIPVSASVRLTAARTGDQELNEESGFVELVKCLRQDVLGQNEVLASRSAAVATATVTEQLLTPLNQQLAEAKGGKLGDAHVQYRAAQHRLDELRRRSSRWQTMLGDEVADLLSDVEYDLRDRTRKIVRIAEEFFDVADPARTWDEFEYWLCDCLADTAETNFSWLIERFQWLSTKIARQVALDEAVPDAADAGDLLDHIGDLTPPRIEKFSVGQQVFVGLRGSYGGLLMFGLATTLAGLPLINPISLGAGAAFGAKTIWDERSSRLKRRQATAKTAAQRHVDDFFLSYGKESRDTARLIQRRLRDHFSSVVERLQTGIAERATEAKRAAEADLADRRKRSQEISAEVERLVGLHKRSQALVTPNARRRPHRVTELAERARAMLLDALELYRDSPRASNWLRRHVDRLDEPLRLAVAGLPRTGRSTLVNSLVGEEIAPLLVEEAGVLTWYRGGTAPRARVYPTQTPPRDVPVARVDGRLHIDLEGWRAADLDRIVVDWPSRALRGLTLIDAPAIGAEAAEPATSTSDAATDVASRISLDADAVVYLMRNLHNTDVGFLQSIQDHPIARETPVNAIVVLSRADEVGGGRIDALTSAKQIARRYRTDAGLRGLCQNVIAVSGLLAHAGRTLTAEEAASLATLAVLPRRELESCLVSADRFGGDGLPVRLDARTRVALLDRFGMFGVRLATTLIRQGYEEPAELSAELLARSGLAELRESIQQCFTDRHDVLKARSAVLALEVVLRMEPRAAAWRLVTALEQLVVSAHEFRELRLLAALHGGRTELPDPLADEARRLVGGVGTALGARLGFDYEPSGAELHGAVAEALRRWQEQAENHALGTTQRHAARIVVRSCEGMVARLARH